MYQILIISLSKKLSATQLIQQSIPFRDHARHLSHTPYRNLLPQGGPQSKP